MRNTAMFLSCLLLCAISAKTQNVGIGITNPPHPFTVAANAQGITQQTTDGLTKIGFYTSGTNAYLQTVTNHALRFATANGATQMILNPAGNLGIGSITPDEAGLVVDTKVGATNAIFGSNTPGVAIESNFPGIGFNSYYNAGRKTLAAGYTGLLSLNPLNGDFSIFNSTTSTAIGAASTIATRLLISKDGDIGVEGNTAPVVPLSFANTVGNKISLWGNTTTAHYGLGIQGALLQVYSNVLNSDIAFG